MVDSARVPRGEASMADDDDMVEIPAFLPGVGRTTVRLKKKDTGDHFVIKEEPPEGLRTLSTPSGVTIRIAGKS